MNRRFGLRGLAAVPLLLLLCIPCVPAAQKASEAAAPKPSLDLLRNRVNAYWNLLSRREKSKAISDVAVGNRKSFAARQEPDFSDPRLRTLEFGTDDKSVWVTVVIKRRLPPIMEVLDFPVREKWVLRSGQWVVLAENQSTVFGLKPGSGTNPSLTGEETDRIRESIRSRFALSTPSVEFETVKQGNPAQIAVRYDLKGDQPLLFVLRDHPRGLVIQGAREQMLTPGTGKSIEFKLATMAYDGEVNGAISFALRDQQVEVPYTANIHGFVYTPISIVPRTLRFAAGEKKKELLIRNNTKMEVGIRSYAFETDALVIESLPQTLAPGAECRLTVILARQDAPVNKWEEILLELRERVEGMPSIGIPIMLNYNPAREKKPSSGLPKEVEEFLRKKPH